MKLKTILLAVAVLLAGAALYVVFKRPAQRAALNMRVEATPQRLERGRYLFENLCDCVGCHTPRDASRWNAYPDPARAGAGFCVYCLSCAM